MATAHLFKVIIGNIHSITSISSLLYTQLATEIRLGSENTEWENTNMKSPHPTGKQDKRA